MKCTPINYFFLFPLSVECSRVTGGRHGYWVYCLSYTAQYGKCCLERLDNTILTMILLIIFGLILISEYTFYIYWHTTCRGLTRSSLCIANNFIGDIPSVGFQNIPRKGYGISDYLSTWMLVILSYHEEYLVCISKRGFNSVIIKEKLD